MTKVIVSMIFLIHSDMNISGPQLLTPKLCSQYV